jgi:hypothetical protein
MIDWLPYSSRETRLKVSGTDLTCFFHSLMIMMSTRNAKIFPMSALAWAVLISTAAATPPAATSRYVKFDLEKCPVVERQEEGAVTVWHCKDAGGFEFFVAENDLRFSIGYGPGGRDQRSFQQSLSPFNTINDTMELRQRAGANAPHASILRYYTEGAMDNETGRLRERGEILVVTKIDGAKACHLAYVDAVANPDANHLAQEAADSGYGFDCEKDELARVGKTGRARCKNHNRAFAA